MGTETAEVTVFIALVFVTILMGNAVLLYVLFGFVRPLAKGLQDEEPSVRTVRDLHAALEELQTWSAGLAEWSAKASRGMVRVGEECGRADNFLQYGLAKLDFNVDKASARLEHRTQEVIDTVSEPLERAAAVVQGVKALLEILELGIPRNGAGPRSAA